MGKIKRMQIQDDLSNEIIYDAKFTKIGTLKSLQLQEQAFIARYFCGRITRLMYTSDLLEFPMMDITISYERKIIHVDVDINKHFDLKMVDIYDATVQDEIKILDLPIWILRCLHLPVATIGITINYPENPSAQSDFYQLVNVTETDANNVMCTKSILKDFQTKSEKIILIEEHQLEDRIVQSYIPGIGMINYRYNIITGNIEFEESAESKYYRKHRYDSNNNCIWTKDENDDITERTYDKYNRLLKEKVNTRLSKEYKYYSGDTYELTTKDKSYTYTISRYKL